MHVRRRAFRLLTALVLSSATVLATLPMYAQGFGGLIDKAKAKASTTANSAPNATNPSSHQASGGELPAPPDPMTVANQQQYARAMMADTRLIEPHGGGPNYEYRRLHQEYNIPLVFTWDEAAVKQLMDIDKLMLWGACRDISSDLVRELGSTQGPYLKPALAKVKEIYLTTTSKERSPHAAGNDPSAHGYHLSFNPATGILTAAMSTNGGINSTSADGAFGHWIQSNVQ